MKILMFIRIYKVSRFRRLIHVVSVTMMTLFYCKQLLVEFVSGEYFTDTRKGVTDLLKMTVLGSC